MRAALRFNCALFLISWVSGLGAGLIPLQAVETEQSTCVGQGQAVDWLQQAQDAKGPFEQRKTAYEQVLKLCPRVPALYASFSALLLEHHDVPNGIKWARQGLAVAPGNPALSLDLGVGLIADGRPDEAVAVLAKLEPTATNQFYLGLAYRAQQDHRAAQRAFSKAVALNYPDPYIFYVLIEQDRNLRDKEAGLRDFQTLDERFPDTPWLHLLLGDAYSAKNDDSDAQDEYRQALERGKNLPIVHFKLGYIAFKRGEYPAAEQDFRQEIGLNPTFGDACLYLGLSLRRMGKVSEAIPFLQTAVAREPTDPLTYDALAAAQIDSKQLPAALQTLQKGENRFPQDGSFPAQLASVLRRLGRTDEAQQQSQRAEVLSRKGNPLRSTAGTAGSPSPQDGNVSPAPATPPQN